MQLLASYVLLRETRFRDMPRTALFCSVHLTRLASNSIASAMRSERPICPVVARALEDDSCSTGSHALDQRMTAGAATEKQRRDLPPAPHQTTSLSRSDPSSSRRKRPCLPIEL